MKPLDHHPAPQPIGATAAAASTTFAVREGRPGRKVTLLLVSALTIMSGATIAPSLPAIEAHFATTENAALLTRLVLTLPALFIALSAPLAGGIADRFGRRPVLIGAVLIYGVAGMSGLVFDTLHGVLLGRALLGVAVAGIMTTATALIGDYFSGAERDRFMGLQAAFVGFGGIAFLTGGGLLAEMHWRAPFAIYGIAFALLPAIAGFIDAPVSAVRHSAIDNGGRVGAGAGVALAALFATALLNSVAFYLIPTQLPFQLQALGTTAPSLAGLAIGMFNLASAAMSLAYGRLRIHIGIAGMFGIGFGLMAAGYGLIAAAGSYGTVVFAVAVTGIGMGAVMPNLMNGALAVAPPAMRGRIAGGLTASIFLGQFLSPLVSQPWIGAFGFAAAFRDMGLLLAAAAVTAGALAFRRTGP